MPVKLLQGQKVLANSILNQPPFDSTAHCKKDDDEVEAGMSAQSSANVGSRDQRRRSGRTKTKVSVDHLKRESIP
jgi:hypothetical protein